jgi:hypothetical protein
VQSAGCFSASRFASRRLGAQLGQAVAGITPMLMNLWEGKPPGFVENAPEETDDRTGRIRNVILRGSIAYPDA